MPPMAGISRDDVAHVARLARLDVTEEELDRFAGQLGAVLDAVARVQGADVADVTPTTHAVPLTNVLRPDVTRPDELRGCLSPAEALAGAPDVAEQRFRVPRILEED